MATDIVPSITAEYTAAIPVPDDGDAYNGAGLVNFALPLANRVEFLNAQLNEAPWVNSDVLDDFTVVFDGGSGSQDRWEMNTYWLVTHSGGSGALNPVVLASEVDSPGILRLAVTGGVGEDFRASKGVVWKFSQARRFTARVRIGATLAGQEVALGFGDGTNQGVDSDTHAVQIRSIDGGDWSIHTTFGGTSDVSIVGSAPTPGTFQQIDIFHDGAGVWTASVDGGAAVTAIANLPTLTNGASVFWAVEFPAAGTRQFDLDFVRANFVVSGRVI